MEAYEVKKIIDEELRVYYDKGLTCTADYLRTKLYKAIDEFDNKNNHDEIRKNRNS